MLFWCLWNQLCFGLAVWPGFPPDFALNRQIDTSGKNWHCLCKYLAHLGKYSKHGSVADHCFALGCMHAGIYITLARKNTSLSASNLWTWTAWVCLFVLLEELKTFCFVFFCKMFHKRAKDHLQSNVPPAKRLRSNLADLFLSNNVSAQRTEEIFEDANLAGAAFCFDIGHPDSVAADPEKKKIKCSQRFAEKVPERDWVATIVLDKDHHIRPKDRSLGAKQGALATATWNFWRFCCQKSSSPLDRQEEFVRSYFKIPAENGRDLWCEECCWLWPLVR